MKANNMALINNNNFLKSTICYKVLVVLLCVCVSPVFSQTRPVLLSAEIISIEKKLADSKLSSGERKTALATLARLFELSGNAEKAAETWEKAAKAASGNSGHTDLLQSARCFAALGEFDKAEITLKPVVSASGNKTLQNKARLLSAQIEALKTGNTEVLSSLLTNPDFAGEKPVLYYSLCKISADPGVQAAMVSRLLSEFPQSPEARILRDDITVSATPAALWLLPPNGLTITNGTPSGGQTIAVAAPPAGSQSGGPAMLQTGLFSREANAKNLAAKLSNAGFNPLIDKKIINGKDHWIVGVFPGSDSSTTMQLLKDKGFESFPVY